MSQAKSDHVSRSMTRLFSDRKIATKIAIGFACVLSITLGISAIGYFAAEKAGDAFEEFAYRTTNVMTVRDIDQGFLGMRRYVREFAVTGDDANVAAAQKQRDAVSKSIDRALEAIKSAERVARVKQIKEQFGVYTKDFDKLVPMRHEQDKLVRDVLDPSGVKLRQDFEDLRRDAAVKAGNGNLSVLFGEGLQLVMQLRLNASKLLARHDQKSAQAADKFLSELKMLMATLDKSIANPEMRKTFEEVKSLVNNYDKGFHRAADLSHQIEELLNGEMKTKAEAIAADAQAVQAAIVATALTGEHEAVSMLAASERLMLLLAIGGLAAGLLLAWLVGRSISVPTRAIGAVLVELANGNKSVDVPYADRGDEVGDNARAAKTFKENLLRIERMEAEQKEAEIRAAAQRKTDMHQLADRFQAAVGEIVDTVSSASTELEAAAGTLTETAETTQTLSATVAAASEQASSNVQTVAAATEELTSSVNEIGRQVQESAKIAGNAVVQAKQTDVRIAELSQAAGRIGDVVKLITAIAEQTNLLALNATIEAARAGDAGRGFAVVASEVKQLASQTAKATEEISTQIASMQTATQESVAAIKDIGATIEQISHIASTIAAAVEEQGAATQEIARNVGEAAKGTADVATNITAVNHGAGATGSASSQVLSSAQSLSSESNRLKLEVDKFLITVRAA